MASASAVLDEINAINTSSTIFIRVWCVTMFILGIFGHALNIYIFTRPVYRFNPCSRYFLAAAISGCLVVFFNLPVRLLQAGFNVDVVTYSLTACRMWTFILFWARAQPSWYIVVASVDRFLCSSADARLRAWSSLTVTKYLIPIISMSIFIAYIHVPIYHSINVAQRLCFPIAGFYQKFFGIWNLIIFSVGPPVLMLTFGFLTIKHIRQSVGRVAPAPGQAVVLTVTQQRRKNPDRQLIRMLLVQCLVLTLTASPTSVQYIYTSIRETMVVDNLQRAKDNFFYVIAGFVALTVPCTSFYLFTLSSKLFRHEITRLFVIRREVIRLSTTQPPMNTNRA